ncbi:MAG: hypothetical protein OXG33_14910 [Chloroflexi bacterium]|nr:hypothetical protein [Chloroflexota bacterium]
MIVDSAVIPGLLLLAAELVVLAVVGFAVARVALGQTDELLALAQGLVVGLALWGLVTNFVVYLWPGLGGTVVAWVVVLALGAGIAWRWRERLRVRPRVAAGFAVAVLALLWVALAGRQLMPNPDPYIHHGFIAAMRAGGPHPPELPWNPGMAVPYHYGVDLLIALLTPPVGPDPAFVTELLGAYIWTSFALVVGTLLLRRGSWPAVVTLGPLLLAAGTQTLLFAAPGVLQVPVPAGMPEAGLRAALGTVYVDGLGASESVPPNVWKPTFPLAYALALVALERATQGGDGHWARRVALAALVGFLGLVDEAVAPVVLALWGLLEAVELWQSRRERAITGGVLRAAAGPALAALLLAFGGGIITAVLFGEDAGALSLGWVDDTSARQPLASFTTLSGGLGLLALGPLALAGGAALLAGRDRFSLAMVVAAGVFVLAGLTLQYEIGQQDVTRLDGHARNFGLLAAMLAVSPRLRALRPGWRWAAGAAIVGLMTWPTVVSPLRAIDPGLSQGVLLANAGVEAREAEAMGAWHREVYPRLRSARLAGYIRDHTDIEARILSPEPTAMSTATGRPNASGFIQAAHLLYEVGPEYQDARRYLEPAALRRLGVAYVHATDAWIEGLPDRARRWLQDPELFELLFRDGGDALYRVRPAFLELEAPPIPASYEALRRAVPPSAVAYVDPAIQSTFALRAASTLAHARLVGEVFPGRMHMRTDFGIEPLGEHIPDVVVVPHWFTPSMFPPAARQPIWWNDGVAVYSPDGAIAPLMPFTPGDWRSVTVRLSNLVATDGRLSFALALHNREPDRWTGQDWIVVETTEGGLPVYPGFGRPSAERWFPGEISSRPAAVDAYFRFDPRTGSLAAGARTNGAVGEDDPLDPGRWTLAMRLIRAVDRGSYVAQEHVGFIPLLRVEVSEAREVAYEVFEGDLNARLRP